MPAFGGKADVNSDPLSGSDRSLTIQVVAEVFNDTGGCLGVGCQKHVRRIQPIHPATGLCRNDFVHALLAHQAIRTPMQAKNRTFDLVQSAALVYATSAFGA